MKIDYLKAVKIAVGVFVSIMLATLLKLPNAVSAGIFTLLSIQDTKKETMRMAAKRLACFAVAVVIAWACFTLLGFHIWVFSLFVLLFVPFCMAVGMPESISVCSVLVSHFFIAQSMELHFIGTEFLLLVIGAGVGVLLNLFMFQPEEGMRSEQEQVDEAFRQTLTALSGVLRGSGEKSSVQDALQHFKKKLETARAKAFRLMENSLLVDQSYYIKFLELRQSQEIVLEQIYTYFDQITYHTDDADLIADFVDNYAKNLHECNDGTLLLNEANQLVERLRAEQLPETREAFEVHAALFQILSDMEYMLMLKSFFVSSLTEEQQKKFMANCPVPTYSTPQVDPKP